MVGVGAMAGNGVGVGRGILLAWTRGRVRERSGAMFDLGTVNDVLLRVMDRGEREVMRRQAEGGAWVGVGAGELYGKVRAMARTLEGMGVGKGDRVVLLSENRWEWPVADFATLALGAVDVPLYTNTSAEQLGYMVRDSGAKVAVVSTAEQMSKLGQAGEMPSLEHVIAMEEGQTGEAVSFAEAVTGWEEMRERNAAFDARLRAVTGEEVATIIYTSGTTGQPKGVPLTHGNLASNLNVTTDEMGFNDRDSSISFLPLSHVLARHLDYAFLCHGALVAYCPKFDELQGAMQAVKPTIFLAVPRVFEKIRQAVEGKAGASRVRSRMLQWALGVGRRHRDEVLAGRAPTGLQWAVADGLVFAKIRAAFGGRVHTFAAGGAPLGEETAGWFADAGIRILEGYGLTETSPVIAVGTPKHYRFGTVGKPVPNVETRFAADGELEVRGPSVFASYWNREDATREVFDAEGWFKTGDIGKIEDGYLTITDRKKELLKTSGGKLIAPQPIESKLKANGLVGQAAMVGDRRKFAAVLISPNFSELERWAKGKGVQVGDRKALAGHDKVRAEYERIVNEVNGSLQHFETIKKVHVVPDEWSVEEGELTPSMKLKRRVVEDKYKDAIESMYREDASGGE